jgi:hypothetical protein
VTGGVVRVKILSSIGQGIITTEDLSHPDDVAPADQPLVLLIGQPALGATQLKDPASPAWSRLQW